MYAYGFYTSIKPKQLFNHKQIYKISKIQIDKMN